MSIIVIFKGKTMNISLTKPLEAFVKSKVETGMYASTSEVIRAGLRALADQELEKNIQKGINEANQGLGKELNDDFITSLMERVEQKIQANQTK